MQLKMEPSNGKSKQSSQQPTETTTATATFSASSSASSSVAPASQQHQNGASSGTLPNGSNRYRPRTSITPSSSSMPIPASSSQVWSPQQYRVFQNTLPLRILVLKDLVGAIIGRGGATIRCITQETHARVDVHRKESSTANENIIMIYGNAENCSQACRRILEVMQQEARLSGTHDVALKMLASNNLIGRIIGKGGNIIKSIQSQTETKVTVSSANIASQMNLERIISIAGQLENICKAEVLISQKLRQCFENDLYQYQQSLMYTHGLGPVMAHQAGPLNLSTGHFSTAQTPLSYSLGTASQSLSARPGLMSGTHGAPSSSSSTGGPGSSSHHLHSVASQSAAPAAFYGGYSLPYMYPPNPVAAAASIPGAYSSGPSGPPYLNFGSYIHPSSMASVESSAKETVTVFIPNSVVGAIIGRRGQTIREFAGISGANIKVTQPLEDEPLISSPSPSTSSSSPDSSKIVERKVTIVGSANAQAQAQYFVFQKVYAELYNQAASSSSSTPNGPYGDPAVLKVEIQVPTNLVRRIIGKSGSVIQQLQHTTGATIKLFKETHPSAATSTTSPSPTNGSSSEGGPSTSTVTANPEDDQTAVHVIGDFQSSFAAQRQIRLIVLRSSSAPSSHPSPQMSQHLGSSQTQASKSAKSASGSKTSPSISEAPKSKPSICEHQGTSTALESTATSSTKTDTVESKPVIGSPEAEASTTSS